MKNKLKTGSAVIITLMAIMVFYSVLNRAVFDAPTDEVAFSYFPKAISKTFVPPTKEVVVAKPEVVPDSYPKTLSILTLNIKSKVQYVGVNAKGNMATPNNFTDVGWFHYGVVPGEKGNAVIAGHVDNGLAMPAVFRNLEKLAVGEEVSLSTVGGKELIFKVIDIKLYDYNSDSFEIFNKKDGKFLTLITCAGVWVPEYRTHNKRLVVTTELVEQ